ncbi:MAG TPA: aminotransferase class V-fold PLP-dependent enzyme [Longimicrobiaceae bacterium]|nr:aminotransferase class V-fold PLP-dependent enzyme [Longimicrobiaceae bacterium]
MISPIFLDYAATAAVRPEPVVEAVAAYLRDIGATPGRGGYGRAVEAGRVALRCRLALAAFLEIPGDPGRIVFQLNATHALNTALRGLLAPGDRVVRTEYDHNAVRRPLAALAERGVVEAVVRGRPDGSVDLDELDALVAGAGERPARLLVLPHVSNVLGSVLPVRAMVEIAHRHGALVLLDAAQSVGHLPVSVGELGVDLLAFSGHKGLLGPQGTGALWVREDVDVAPLLSGGTGADSLPPEMPASYPDHLEAGTQNGPGIAGLLAGVEWLRERGVESQHGREVALKHELRRGLETIPGVRVRSPASPEGTGIVTITVDGVTSAEVARRLDRDFGILVRAGLHCAPDAHRVLGTLETGAVRFSIGWATTREEIGRAVEAVRELVGGER